MNFHSQPFSLPHSDTSNMLPSFKYSPNKNQGPPLVFLSPMKNPISIEKPMALEPQSRQSMIRDSSMKDLSRELRAEEITDLPQLKASLILKEKEISRLKEIFKQKALHDSTRNEQLSSQLNLLAEKSDIMISERRDLENTISTQSATIRALQSKVASLQQFEEQVESIDIITTALENRLKLTVQENESLREQLESSYRFEEMYREISSNLPELTNSHEGRGKRLAYLESTLQKETEAHEALKQIHKSCSSKLSAVADELTKSQHQLSQQNSKSVKLEKELTIGLQEQAIELERHMRERELGIELELEAGRKTIGLKNSEIERLKSEKDQLEYQLQIIQRELKDIQAEHTANKDILDSAISTASELENLQSSHSLLLSTHNQLESRLSSICKENQELKAKNEELESVKGKLEGAERIRKDWQKKIENLLLENDKLSELLNSKENELESLSNQLSNTKSLLATKENDFSAYSSKASELLSINETLNNELITLKTSARRTEESNSKAINELNQERNELLTLLEETRDFIREKDGELMSMKEHNIFERESYVRKLLESIQSLKNSNSSKSLEISGKDEKIAKLTSNLKFIVNKFKSLYSEITSDNGLLPNLSSHIHCIPEMREVLVKSQSSLDEYRGKVFERLERLGKEKMGLFTRIEEVEESKREIERRNQELEKGLSSKSFQHNSMLKQYESLKSLNNSFKAESNELFLAIKSKKDDNDRLSQENENLVLENRQLGTAKLDLEESYKSAICKLEHQDLRVEQLQRECEELAHVSSEFSRELDGRRNEVMRVVEEFEELQMMLKGHLGHIYTN